jgi:hypothetical protein
MLLQALADEGQPGGRVLAARGLASARLKEAQQQSVVDALPQLGPVEVSSVLPLFRELRQGPTAERLVKTLADLPALAVIPPAALRDALGQLDASTSHWTKPWRECMPKCRTSRPDCSSCSNVFLTATSGAARRCSTARRPLAFPAMAWATAAAMSGRT